MTGSFRRGKPFFAALIAVVCLSSCHDGGKMSNAVEALYCVEPSRDPALNGLSLAVVKRDLGNSGDEEIFALSENTITEFRIEILNQYPLPQEQGRLIREIRWTESYCNTAVWFVQDRKTWTSFDNLTWNDDTEF